MAEDRSSHWVSVVPEIFYDVLARILPGFGFSLATANIAWAFHRCLLPRGQSIAIYGVQLASGGALFASILIAMATFWIVGLLLTPTGDRLCRMKSRAEVLTEMVKGHKVLFEKAERFSILVHEFGPDIWSAIAAGKHDEGFASIVYQQLHEYLKDQKSAWQGVLTKNQAEVTFYANTYAGMIWTLTGSLIFVPLFLVISRQTSVGVLWSWNGLLFLCTGLVPPILVAVNARRGAQDKHRRLWLRHVACLTIDLKDRREVPVTHEDARAAIIDPMLVPEAIELDS